MTHCETCKFFVAVKDHQAFEGTCHNMKATLGAVIQTSRKSTCNYYERGGNGELSNKTEG